jgi:Ca2+-binding RTX toxin-like protein
MHPVSLDIDTDRRLAGTVAPMRKTLTVLLFLAVFLALVAAASAEIKRGDSGANTFAGTPQHDWYWGYGGNDTLYGRAASDNLYGGADNDLAVGGRGRDFVYGGDGADELRLGRGDDFAWGGLGPDRIFASFGADTIHGGPGDDTITAATDDNAVDSVDCGPGNADHAVIRPGDTTMNCETVNTVT